MSEQSLNVGTVVKITDIVQEKRFSLAHLRVGMEGVVQYHNKIFEIDDEAGVSEQQGPEGQPMYDFVMPGSNLRIGPIMKMPDDHKVVVWIVKGKIWNITNIHILFDGSIKWYTVRSGEVLTLTGTGATTA